MQRSGEECRTEGEKSLQELKKDKYEKWSRSQGIEMALPTPGSQGGGDRGEGGGRGFLSANRVFQILFFKVTQNRSRTPKTWFP